MWFFFQIRHALRGRFTNQASSLVLKLRLSSSHTRCHYQPSHDKWRSLLLNGNGARPVEGGHRRATATKPGTPSNFQRTCASKSDFSGMVRQAWPYHPKSTWKVAKMQHFFAKSETLMISSPAPISFVLFVNKKTKIIARAPVKNAHAHDDKLEARRTWVVSEAQSHIKLHTPLQKHDRRCRLLPPRTPWMSPETFGKPNYEDSRCERVTSKICDATFFAKNVFVSFIE